MARNQGVRILLGVRYFSKHLEILWEFINQENFLIPINSPLTMQKPMSRKQIGALIAVNPLPNLFFLMYVGTWKTFKCYRTSNKPTFCVQQVFLRYRLPRTFKEKLKNKDKVKKKSPKAKINYFSLNQKNSRPKSHQLNQNKLQCIAAF